MQPAFERQLVNLTSDTEVSFSVDLKATGFILEGYVEGFGVYELKSDENIALKPSMSETGIFVLRNSFRQNFAAKFSPKFRSVQNSAHKP